MQRMEVDLPTGQHSRAVVELLKRRFPGTGRAALRRVGSKGLVSMAVSAVVLASCSSTAQPHSTSALLPLLEEFWEAEFEYASSEEPRSLDAFLELVHPDSRAGFKRNFEIVYQGRFDVSETPAIVVSVVETGERDGRRVAEVCVIETSEMVDSLGRPAGPAETERMRTIEFEFVAYVDSLLVADQRLLREGCG